MRRRLTWLLGVLGIAGLIAYLKRRRHPEHGEAPAPADQAAELRRTLDETRAQAEGLEESQSPAPEEGELGARREDVHERGRSALDDMAPPSE